MRILIFGLSITSSWGNGHATIYRGLLKALMERGHDVLFLERNKPWYASCRDLGKCGEVVLYESLQEVQTLYERQVRDADCVMVGSYVPEGAELGRWVTATARGVTLFYDIDTPITLAALERGECDYLTPDLVGAYTIYLSFTGGPTLSVLEKQWGARQALPFYCCADPARYFPEQKPLVWDLGYLGTYSADRQPLVDKLLLAPAAAYGAASFVVAGSGYPESVPWPANVQRIEHLAPAEHRSFYNAQRFTLNVTRAAMVQAGYSPSVRLFEAAACGRPIISDAWNGLEEFFEPGKEILVAQSPAEVIEFLGGLPAKAAAMIGERARQRFLSAHTSRHRAIQLECLVIGKWKGMVR